MRNPLAVLQRAPRAPRETLERQTATPAEWLALSAGHCPYCAPTGSDLVMYPGGYHCRSCDTFWTPRATEGGCDL